MVGAEQRWSTLRPLRTVVVTVHTITTLMRLLDIVRLLESDPRVQLVFTKVPDQLGDGVDWWLRRLGAKVLPWEEIPKETFDLALSASLHQLDAVRARRLVVPHGAGFIKLWPAWAWNGPEDTRQAYGLDDLSLLDQHGDVIPDALVVPHAANLATVERQCPQALPVALVGGDPCYDGLLSSVLYRELFRRDMGVRAGQTLVVLASTWGEQSLFGARFDLFASLMSTLPADHRLVGVLHPGVWSEHGPRQVLAWLSHARAKGMDVVMPGGDWRGLLVAADWLISDHSSLSVYGAAIGIPLTLGYFPVAEVDPDSVMADLAAVSPRLTADPPAAQLYAARQARPEQQHVASRGVSSVPGQSAGILRTVMYRLMDLTEPPDPTEPPRPDRDSRPQLVQDGDLYW
jgi:hypothetical protein